MTFQKADDWNSVDYEKSRKRACFLAFLNIIFGALGTVLLILDVCWNLNKLLNFVNREKGLLVSMRNTETKNAENIHLLSGHLLKIYYFVSYATQTILGMFLLDAVTQNSYTALKKWTTVTFVFIFTDVLIVSPILILEIQGSYNDLIYLSWILPLWIITIVSLWFVSLYENKLKNYQVLTPLLPPHSALRV